MITFIFFLLIWGAIIGGLARLALPGPDPMSLGETVLIGVGSSLVAGVLFRSVQLGAVIGAVCRRPALSTWSGAPGAAHLPLGPRG